MIGTAAVAALDGVRAERALQDCPKATHDLPARPPSPASCPDHPRNDMLLARKSSFAPADIPLADRERVKHSRRQSRGKLTKELCVQVRDIVYIGSQPRPFPHS